VKKVAAFIAMSTLASFGAQAVILFSAGDPSTNTSAPTGDLAAHYATLIARNADRIS
jgi:hypothetical protein